MIFKRRPSGRDCALAQAALENMKAHYVRPLSGLSPIPPLYGEAGGRRPRGEGSAATSPDGAALPVNARDAVRPGGGVIRLIDLERRAHFARIAS